MTTTVHERITHTDTRARLAVSGEHWIAGSGFAYVAAWLAGLAIGFATSAPGPTDTIEKIGEYYATHREAAMINAYLVDGVTGAALLVFAAALWNALRQPAGFKLSPEGENAVLSSILFGTGVAAAGLSLLQGLFTQVLADRVAALGDPTAIRMLFDLNSQADTYKLLALGMFIAATSLLTLHTRLLPRWIGWLGIALAPALVIAGWNFALSVSAQYAAYAVLLLALLVWVMGVSVVSLRRAKPRTSATMLSMSNDSIA